jgi:hypothetical protein
MQSPHTTSRDDLRRRAESWFNALWVRGEADEAHALHAPGFIDRCPAAGRRADSVGFAAALRALHEVLPDLAVRIVDLVIDVERARVGVVWTATATRRGRELALRGIEAVRFDAEGLAVERWGDWPALD